MEHTTVAMSCARGYSGRPCSTIRSCILPRHTSRIVSGYRSSGAPTDASRHSSLPHLSSSRSDPFVVSFWRRSDKHESIAFCSSGASRELCRTVRSSGLATHRLGTSKSKIACSRSSIVGRMFRMTYRTRIERSRILRNWARSQAARRTIFAACRKWSIACSIHAAPAPSRDLRRRVPKGKGGNAEQKGRRSPSPERLFHHMKIRRNSATIDPSRPRG